MTLSEQEKVQLAELFEQPGARVLKKVLEAKIIELGLLALNSRTEVYTAEQRGFSQGLEWVWKDWKGTHSAVYKLEEKAKQK